VLTGIEDACAKLLNISLQTPEQREQVRRIAELPGSGGILDDVWAWFLKAGKYIQQAHHQPHIAFVSTNSIGQDEQLAQ